MKKSIAFILALILSLFLFQVEPPIQANTEAGQAQTYTYNNGGIHLDKATVPQGEVTIGTNGQIRPLQDSLIKDAQYAFVYQVSNPTILSIDEKGNWHALQSGTTTITIYPTSLGSSPHFEAELDALGIQRSPAEPVNAYPPQTFTVTILDNALIPVSRLYHPGLKTHLYTKDANEVQQLAQRGWRIEGVAWSTRENTGDPVYRLYHSGLRVHLYTTDANEYNVLATRGWRQEGIAYRSNGTKAIYRLYHTGIRKHLYTTDFNEKNILSTRGWRYEGIAWYVE
ncbi:hypothetical protein [Streptococcus ovis]|uniref:hypothetical protein n=1 Tax=Streptococcus ovis TaxID=82806 RepID=UPI0003633EC8|nr:hypothetical protein [Streptococcus ovis]